MHPVLCLIQLLCIVQLIYMNITDIEKLPENVAESILMFFIRRAYGQDVKLKFVHKDYSDEDFVMAYIKENSELPYTKLYLLAFDESTVEQLNSDTFAFDLNSYQNICIPRCHAHDRYKLILKTFVQYASKNWFVSHLPDQKHVFDRSSSIEEALIGLELGK